MNRVQNIQAIIFDYKLSHVLNHVSLYRCLHEPSLKKPNIPETDLNYIYIYIYFDNHL